MSGRPWRIAALLLWVCVCRALPAAATEHAAVFWRGLTPAGSTTNYYLDTNCASTDVGCTAARMATTRFITDGKLANISVDCPGATVDSGDVTFVLQNNSTDGSTLLSTRSSASS